MAAFTLVLFKIILLIQLLVGNELYQSCQLDAIYSSVLGNAHFEFSTKDLNSFYEIIHGSDSIRVRVNYNPVDIITNNCTMTGNVSTGNLSFVMTVQLADYGTYKLIRNHDHQIQCQVLYVLGKPTQPIIQNITKVISEHDVTLLCTSNSTTKPTTHDRSMNYSWRINDVTNPTNTRYIYSSSRNHLTLSALSKNDTGMTFVCTATEIVVGGLQSDASERRVLNVLFGPENIRLNSSETVFVEELGNNFGPVRCLADCNPGCSYKWIKDTLTVSGNAILYIDNLSQYKNGVYTCIVSGEIGTVQLNITINVIYGPDMVKFIPNNSSYTKHEEEYLSNIECSAGCFPACQYRWTKQEELIVVSNTSILSLEHLHRSEAGVYICTATNPRRPESRSLHVNINVIYGPDKVELMPATVNYTYHNGDNMTDIQCLAECYPPCGYEWTKEGEMSTVVSDTGILSIGTLNRSDAGTYNCTATNMQIIRSKQVKINVIYGPDTIVLHPAKDTYTIHESEHLPDIRCSAACFPPCTFTWMKQGQTASIGDIFHLGRLSRSDAGTYTCTAANPRMSKTQTRNVQVNVIYGPDEAVLSSNSQLILTEGRKNVGIRCTSDCYPSCYASWSNLTSSPAVISNDTLSLDQVTRYQSGSYKCTTRNTVVEYNHTADTILNITVWYAPDVTITLSNNSLVEHTDAELKCLASGVPNNYSYVALTQSWTSVTIPNTRGPVTNTRVNSSLNLIALRLQDTGTYTCEVSNGVIGLNGNIVQKSSVNLIINVSPKILLKQNFLFTSSLSTSVNITLPFYSAESTNTVSFIRGDGIYIQNDNRTSVSYINSPVKTKFYGVDVTLDGYLALLHIIDLQEADFMNYTITIQNSIGNSTLTINLIPDGPPSKPENWTLETVRETEVIVSWIRGFHGGHSQTFVTQYSTDGIVWYNSLYIDGGKSTSKELINGTIDSLSPSTLYYIRMYSNNSKGNSTFTHTLNFTTRELDSINEAGELDAGPIIGGTVSAALVTTICAVVVFVVYRRRHNLKYQGGENNDLKPLRGKPIQLRGKCEYENASALTRRDVIDDEEDDKDPEAEIWSVGPEGPEYGNIGATVKPIPLGQLRHVCRNAKQDPTSLYAEFKTIPQKFQLDTNVASKTEYKPKIRYREMHAYDKNRVKLPLQPGNFKSDFINASYIRGYTKEKAYIASQGPMETTLEDTWRMIWTNDIATVVMLTNCLENKRIKCVQYWPEEDEKRFGKFFVKTVSEEIYSEYTIRTLSCQLSGSKTSRTITQYHFTAWPDKDVPDTCISLVQLWRKVKYSAKANVTPWMVHCSAGVGRTGTFIALDYLFDQGQAEGFVNVHACVTELRDQRLHMVQTSQQYVFLHEAALETLNPIATVCRSDEYKEMWHHLQTKAPGSNDTILKKQYKEISNDDKQLVEDESDGDALIATSAKIDKFGDARLYENMAKNRNPAILPPDAYRPVLITDEAHVADDYINAAVLSTHNKADTLIITQVPLKNTIVDFLRMVWDYEISTIVLLDDQVPEDCVYWQTNKGRFSVELLSERKQNSYTLRLIRFRRGNSETRDITQFHFTSWHSDVPETKGLMLKLISDVERSYTNTGESSPLVVQCMDGASRSGLCCVLWAVLERMKCDREVGIAETIKYLKARRSQIISTFEQYKFCHDFILEYLDSCSEYANVM